MYNLQRNNNINKYFKVNYLFFIICVSFLFYQSIDLLTEFMSGKTVINISVENIRNTTLPAITLFAGNLDLDRLSLTNKNISILNEEYFKLIENANRSRISDIKGFMETLHESDKYLF